MSLFEGCPICSYSVSFCSYFRASATDPASPPLPPPYSCLSSLQSCLRRGSFSSSMSFSRRSACMLSASAASRWPSSSRRVWRARSGRRREASSLPYCSLSFRVLMWLWLQRLPATRRQYSISPTNSSASPFSWKWRALERWRTQALGWSLGKREKISTARWWYWRASSGSLSPLRNLQRLAQAMALGTLYFPISSSLIAMARPMYSSKDRVSPMQISTAACSSQMLARSARVCMCWALSLAIFLQMCSSLRARSCLSCRLNTLAFCMLISRQQGCPIRALLYSRLSTFTRHRRSTSPAFSTCPNARFSSPLARLTRASSRQHRAPSEWFSASPMEAESWAVFSESWRREKSQSSSTTWFLTARYSGFSLPLLQAMFSAALAKECLDLWQRSSWASQLYLASAWRGTSSFLIFMQLGLSSCWEPFSECSRGRGCRRSFLRSRAFLLDPSTRWYTPSVSWKASCFCTVDIASSMSSSYCCSLAGVFSSRLASMALYLAVTMGLSVSFFLDIWWKCSRACSLASQNSSRSLLSSATLEMRFSISRESSCSWSLLFWKLTSSAQILRSSNSLCSSSCCVAVRLHMQQRDRSLYLRPTSFRLRSNDPSFSCMISLALRRSRQLPSTSPTLSPLSARSLRSLHCASQSSPKMRMYLSTVAWKWMKSSLASKMSLLDSYLAQLSCTCRSSSGCLLSSWRERRALLQASQRSPLSSCALAIFAQTLQLASPSSIFTWQYSMHRSCSCANSKTSPSSSIPLNSFRQYWQLAITPFSTAVNPQGFARSRLSMAPYWRVILRVAEVRSRDTTLNTLRALNSISSSFLKASLASPNLLISTNPWSYSISSSPSPPTSTTISNRQESLSMNFQAQERFSEVDVNPRSSMQLPTSRLAASLFLSLAPRQVTMRLLLGPSLRQRWQQCLMAWQVSLKGMVTGLNSSAVWESLRMELVSAQQKVSRTQKFMISLAFLSEFSSQWSILLYSSRLASSLGTSAYRISTMSVNSLRQLARSFLSLSLRAPQRQRRQAVTSVGSWPVRGMKLGNLSLVLSFSRALSTITNLASLAMSSAACLAASLISMNMPLTFLLARLSSKARLMPRSRWGLQRQMAMMFLWSWLSWRRGSALSTSATTLKKQLCSLRNLRACSQLLQMGTSYSFSMCSLQIALISPTLSSPMLALRMNSQMKDAFPERNPLTISMFRSLSRRSRSLKILLSSSFVCSLFFLSLDRPRSMRLLEAAESMCLLMERARGLGLLPPRQSQSDCYRQLFLLGIMFILWMSQLPPYPFWLSFSYVSSPSPSPPSFIIEFDISTSLSLTSISEACFDLFSQLWARKLTLGSSRQSSEGALLGCLEMGRISLSLWDRSSSSMIQFWSWMGLLLMMSLLLLGGSPLSWVFLEVALRILEWVGISWVSDSSCMLEMQYIFDRKLIKSALFATPQQFNIITLPISVIYLQ